MIGWLIMAAVVGGFIWILVGPFIRNPRAAAAEWGADFRRYPAATICTILGSIGLLLFFGTLLSFGQFVFDVSTPWGAIKSFWLGGMLALLAIPGLFLRRPGRRRKQPAPP
jgi:hypothetical protein